MTIERDGRCLSDLELDVAFAETRIVQHVDDELTDERFEVCLFERKREVAMLQTHRQIEIVEQFLHILSLTLDHMDVLFAFGVVERIILEQFGVPLDGGERGLQVVRYVAHPLFPSVIEFCALTFIRFECL